MLQSILADAASQHGDKIALVAANRTLSYREFEDLSTAFAGALRQRGIDDGDRVSIYSQNRWEWVVAYHGIVKAGAVVNPINVMLTAEEVAFVLNDCGARAVVTSGDKAPAIVGLREQATASRDRGHASTTARPGTESFHHVDGQRRAARRDSPMRPAPHVAVDHRVHVGHHRPSRRARCSRTWRCSSTARSTATMHVRTSADIVVTALPAPHVYGNVVINGTFMAGGTVVLDGPLRSRRGAAAASPSTVRRCSRGSRRCTR